MSGNEHRMSRPGMNTERLDIDYCFESKNDADSGDDVDTPASLGG